MSGFFKRLLFTLQGGIPSTSKYEARRTTLENKYAKYNTLKQTISLLRYQELAVQVATPRSQSGLPKKEWKAMKLEFANLRKSAEVTEFFKLQKSSHNFHAITDWDLKFEDNFGSKMLDKVKWHTQVYVGNTELHMDYSPADENHVYTHGANVSVDNHVLKITTKHEHASGLGFSNTLGFIPMEREYTSGIVNTGENYQLHFGKIEAKIRYTLPAKGMYHAMWLGAGKMLPHVNVVRIGDRIEFSTFTAATGNEQQVRRHVDLWQRGIMRQNTYYIVTLEWNEQNIIWRLNGRTMFVVPNTIAEPMYLAFSSGVTGHPHATMPATFEVEWVKAYQRHEQLSKA